MNFSVQIKDPPASTEASVLRAFALKLNQVLHAAAEGIRREVAGVATGLIAGTPEYDDLIRGDLRGHMGLENPESSLAAVLRQVAEGVRVAVEPPMVKGRRIEGGLRVGILPGAYQDLIGLSEASYVSPPSGTRIEWLRWMIEAGDLVVIKDYGITFNLPAGRRADSRSGMALMFAGGRGWAVPEWASGTPEDNFLTRAFDGDAAEARLAAAIRRQIQSRI